MQLSAVLAMGLAVLPSVVVAGYNNPHGLGFTCQDNFRLDGHKLIANCPTISRANRRTRQDLNLCVGNKKGTLVQVNNGNYADSCRLCSVKHLKMTCLCRTGTGNVELQTTIDLDYVLSNRDGYQWCYDHRAAPY